MRDCMEDSLLDRQIMEEHELPIRARNCLHSYGIKTVRDLFSLEEKNLLLMKNLGRKTFEEIREYKERIKNGQDSICVSDLFCPPFKSLQEKNIFDIYEMSARAKNCLITQGIRKLSDLCALDKTKLLSIKNLGKKTLSEIERVIEDAKQYLDFEDENVTQTNESILNHAWHLKGNLDFYSIRGKDNAPVYDCPVKEIPFPNIFQKIFERMNITSFRELLTSDSGFYIHNQKLDTKRLDEFFSIILSYTEITGDDKKRNYLLNEIASFFDEKLYSSDKPRIKKLAVEFLQKNPEGKARDFILSDVVVEIFKERLYKKIDHITLTKNLDDLFPGALKQFQDDVISIMLEKGFIEINGDSIRRKHPLFKDYVLSLEDERKRDYVVDVILGKTYNEIATEYGISRERVRQVVGKEFSRTPMVEEDVLLALFSKYDISYDDLISISKPDKYARFYIKKKWKKGNAPSEGILNDVLIPLEMRRSYEQFLNRDVLFIDGRRIRKNFNSIIDYLVENECNDYTTIDELKNKYHSLLAANAVEITRQLEFQTATHVKISGRQDILWVQGAKFRYYDISEADFGNLIKILHLESLSNVEISTKYFLDRYANELAEFDIHDEYELHNLLRKRLKDNVEFLRMPNIKFGKASRKDQVYELLEQESPIEVNTLAEKYEELYGVRTSVFLASYVDDINLYLENGVYSLSYPQMNEEEYSFISDSLKEDVYELQYIKSLFHQKYPKENLNKINSYTLKKLGFFIYSPIVYRSKKESFDAFFRLWLDRRDIVDFTNYLWLIKNPVAYNRLNTLKKEYEWFEYEPYKYISLRRLQQVVTGKQDFVSYAESAISFTNGEPFTVKSLKYGGFHHKLNDLGFNTYFYESVLKNADSLQFCRVGEHYVFVKYPHNISLITLISGIIEEKKCVGIHTLLSFLEEKYGIVIDKRKVCEKVTNSGYFYSQTMEKVYINYETFIGDLENESVDSGN